MQPSIRVLMVALCVTLITVTAVSTLAVTYSFSLRAAKMLSEKHAVALATKAKGDVEEFLGKPIGFIAGLQYSFMQNDHQLPNVAEQRGDDKWYMHWWEYFVSAMRAVDFKYQYAVMGFDDGNYAGCKLVSAGFMCRVFAWKTRAATGKSNVFERTFNISNYAQIAQGSKTTSYDPRTRVWYGMVDHAPFAMEWSPVYLSAMPTLPIVDVNAAVYNATGALIGIVGLTFELGALSDFLTNLATTKNTRGVLLDNDNMLLAANYDAPFLQTTTVPKNYSGAVGENCLRSDVANDASSSVIVCRESLASYPWPALGQFAADHPSSIAYNSTGIFAQRIQLGGEVYYAVVAPIKTHLSKAMNWRFVLLMPERDTISEIVAGRNVAMGVTAAILVVSMAISFFAVRQLLHPLNDISERMYRTATLQDDAGDGEPSSLQEISRIQIAYATMKCELGKVKSYLPQSVLAALYPDEENADEDEGAIDDEAAGLINKDGDDFEGSRPSTRHGGSSRRSSAIVSSSVHANKTATGRGAGGGSTAYAVGRSANKTGYAASPAVATSLNTALKLVTRRVTVLCVNISGFNGMMKKVAQDDVLRIHGQVVSAIFKIVRDNKGVVDSFHGDRFIAIFNAVTTLGSHAQAAGHTATQINQALREATCGGEHICAASCGLASGQATVGNMGSEEMRRFCVLGPVYAQALTLERLCKKYSKIAQVPTNSTGGCLMGGPAIVEIEQFFDFQLTDVVMLPGASINEPKRSRVAWLKEPHSVSCDEWMYQLEEGSGKSPYTLHNEAFELFLAGKLDDALESLARNKAKAEAEKRDVDPVSLYLGDLIQEAKESPTMFDARTYTNPLPDFYPVCNSGGNALIDTPLPHG